MDVIVIAKESHGKGDKPVVVYCGQCREEAVDAVIKAGDKFERYYFINPEPFQLIRSPDALKRDRAEFDAKRKAQQAEDKAREDAEAAEKEQFEADQKAKADAEEAARKQYREDEAKREAELRLPKKKAARAESRPTQAEES